MDLPKNWQNEFTWPQVEPWCLRMKNFESTSQNSNQIKWQCVYKLRQQNKQNSIRFENRILFLVFGSRQAEFALLLVVQHLLHGGARIFVQVWQLREPGTKYAMEKNIKIIRTKKKYQTLQLDILDIIFWFLNKSNTYYVKCIILKSSKQNRCPYRLQCCYIKYKKV